MKIIEVDEISEKCTVELTKKEVAFLGGLRAELFGGAFNVSDDEWVSVPLSMSRAEARAFLLEFRQPYLALQTNSKN